MEVRIDNIFTFWGTWNGRNKSAKRCAKRLAERIQVSVFEMLKTEVFKCTCANGPETAKDLMQLDAKISTVTIEMAKILPFRQF
jgi:CRISPR/Cas system-associated endoribonuclease Cas2